MLCSLDKLKKEKLKGKFSSFIILDYTIYDLYFKRKKWGSLEVTITLNT